MNQTRRIRRRVSLSFLFVLGALLVAPQADAVTLDVVGGELVGAFDVDVDGELYNVAFVDGSCEDVFSGCDELSDFFFDSSEAALDSQALLDQVFLDVIAGDFDTEPELTEGCTGESRCEAWTPYDFGGFGILASKSINRYPDFSEPDIVAVGSASTDLFLTSLSVYAVWSPVPEPSTAMLLAAGLGLLGLRGRPRGV